ncbi:MAG: hypothetical protein RSA79_02195 [Oscillospiraceae bacterium]
MNNQNEMLQILSPLKLYNLDSINNVTAETFVFGKFLDDINQKIDSLLERIFIENVLTNPSIDLSHFKRIFAIPTDTTSDKVYNIIVNRMKIDNTYFTINKIKTVLLSYGFEVAFNENFAGNNLTITVTNDKGLFWNNDEKIACIKSCLPHKTDITYTVVFA